MVRREGTAHNLLECRRRDVLLSKNKKFRVLKFCMSICPVFLVSSKIKELGFFFFFLPLLFPHRESNPGLESESLVS